MDYDDQYHFRMPLRVRDYEVDSQGIVNNAIYLHYLEHTRHEFCRQVGTSFRQMQAEGVDPVIRSIQIQYLTPLTLGEDMESCLSLRREGARFIFVQDIYRLPDHRPRCESPVYGGLPRKRPPHPRRHPRRPFRRLPLTPQFLQ